MSASGSYGRRGPSPSGPSLTATRRPTLGQYQPPRPMHISRDPKGNATSSTSLLPSRPKSNRGFSRGRGSAREAAFDVVEAAQDLIERGGCGRLSSGLRGWSRRLLTTLTEVSRQGRVDCTPRRGQLDAHTLQHPAAETLFGGDKGEEQVLTADVVVPEPDGFPQRHLENLLGH